MFRARLYGFPTALVQLLNMSREHQEGISFFKEHQGVISTARSIRSYPQGADGAGDNRVST